MKDISSAIPWAVAMLLIAFCNRAEVLTDDSATTMFTMLSVLAVITLQGEDGCEGRGARCLR